MDSTSERKELEVAQIPMDPMEIQTQMIPLKTREGIPVKMMKKSLAGGPESYSAYGPSWANASNTPFREYKHFVHEGGIASPLVVHWPNSIKGKGDFRHEPSHLIDIMATCIEVSGARYPKKFNGNEIIPLARGEAKQILEEAKAYKVKLIKSAEGEALRFKQLFTEYEKSPVVTRERLYLESVESVLGNTTKVMIDLEGFWV